MVSKVHVRKLAGDHYLTQVGKGRGRAVHLEIEVIYLATGAKRVFEQCLSEQNGRRIKTAR
jgi:hypothetical protein